MSNIRTTAIFALGIAAGGLLTTAFSSCGSRLMAPFSNADRLGEELSTLPGLAHIRMRPIDIEKIPECSDMAEDADLPSAFEVNLSDVMGRSMCLEVCTAKDRASRFLSCEDAAPVFPKPPEYITL